MKLTPKQFESLRSSVETMVTGLAESLITDTMDEYYQGEVTDTLDEDDFTEDEIDEIVALWNDSDDEGGIDNDIYENFINEVVNSIMEKYK